MINPVILSLKVSFNPWDGSLEGGGFLGSTLLRTFPHGSKFKGAFFSRGLSFN